MPLVTTKEMFEKSMKEHFSIGAFNINNMEFIQAITEACEEAKSPVILQVSSSAIKYARMNYLIKMVEAAVESTTIPIALHLDHGPDFETCKKCIDAGFTSVLIDGAKYDFEEPAELTDEEVSEILIKSSDLVSWVSDVKEYALNQAIQGKNYPNLKLVEGRSNRKYLNEEEAAKAVIAAGYDPYEKKLLGITSMTSLLGKTKFNEVLGNLIYKPQGKPTLVLESDKRPAMQINDFIDEREENNYE